ncbi:MAG: redoxin domain-containing protein [Clostridia bacterium]|nr:redoxin domain-containing protein [Clostridia bacterium]
MKKRVLSVVLVLALLLSMAAVLGGCKKGGSGGGAAAIGGGTNYTVTVKTAGGMAMEKVAVYVYTDDSLSDLILFKETDAEGKVTFDLAASDKYAITLSGAPKGYKVEKSYKFAGTSALITLTSSLIAGESLAGATLGLGDVMYDFEVTTPKGEKVVLSEMLKEKKMVLINFFYTTCGPCANEFPYMQEAYNEWKDSVGIIAIDPLDGQNVETFQNQMGLTFPMAGCPASWSTTFGVTGYPTSIVVDRYGVICLIEVGGLTSTRPFVSMFEHFSAEKYEQKIFQNGLADLVTNVKPNVTMDDPADIAAAINADGAPITYRAEEGEDAEYAWPFILAEKDGKKCIKSSNKEIDNSFAIIYADVELKKGQAVGFDYICSSEWASDVLVVIVDGEDIFQISGADEEEEWTSCYPWVATKDGTYEVALCYLKDESDKAGEDTVYIRNFRVVDEDDIDVETYIPRLAASENEDGSFSYVSVVYNSNDGYYHVGSANGPLLLADLMGYTLFNEEESVYEIAYDGGFKEGNKNYYDDILKYFNCCSNSSLNGVTSVNKELADLLKKFGKIAGFDEDENEWLKICKYYQNYGTSKQLEDPIKGLMPFSAYDAKLGKNVSTNYFYYNRVIMPRGLLAEFIPSTSGVYRITSRSESTQGVDGWIFDENRNELLAYEMDERMYNDDKNVSMVFYMEAGKKYYIDIAFWDVYEEGYIYYDIEYVASSYELFRLCSPGYFTYDSNATGDAMYYLIHGGIDVVLKDGKYYEDLGKDANGKQRYGSLIYADFTGVTSLFSNPIATVNAYDENGNLVYDEAGKPAKIKGMIDMGGFDFSKTENDLYVLAIVESKGGKDQAIAYLKEQWGEEYDAYAEIYKLDEVLAGRYHGTGPDLTEEMRGYVDDMLTSPAEAKGCVVVTERLAEILQLLLEKYTFENVDYAWTKVCYYYDYLGPNG